MTPQKLSELAGGWLGSGEQRLNHSENCSAVSPSDQHSFVASVLSADKRDRAARNLKKLRQKIAAVHHWRGRRQAAKPAPASRGRQGCP